MSRDIAIIGLACCYPGARNAAQFWHNIISKVSSIAEADPIRWKTDVFFDPEPGKDDRVYSKLGGYMPNTFAFNPLKYGIMPNTVGGGEPDQFLLLRTAFEALEDAGYLTRAFNRERTSIIIGKGNYTGPGFTWLMQRTAMAEMVREVIRGLRPDLEDADVDRLVQGMKRKLPRLTPENAGGLVPNVGTGRVCNRLDLMGRNFNIDAACASSHLATETAIDHLLSGRDDMALVGGLHLFAEIPFLSVFATARALSPGQFVRSFDANADGTMSGEGIGILVIKRLADAERDRDRIYAVIKGAGSASDGKAKAVLAPRVEGEALALKRAYEAAGVSPSTIQLIEGHGTGTLVGDATEIEALQRVFGPSPFDRPVTALGSVKTNIGHAMPAAGAAGLIKTALAVYHRVYPPTLHVTDPHPLLKQPQSRFYPNTELRPWIHSPHGEPRRAGVNAFGFGGINGHIVMEEYRPADESAQPTLLREWESELFVFEATDRAALLARLAAIRAYAVAAEGVALRDLAFTLNTSLTGLPVRAAIVASSFEDLAAKIDRFAPRIEKNTGQPIRDRGGLFYFPSEELRGAKVAFLFPGEGSQYLNMLADLAVHFPEVRRAFDQADGAVKDASRVPPSAILYPPPAFNEEQEAAAEAQLWSIDRATELVLTADGAMMHLLQRLGVQADMMAGHSAGEWIAMASAGVLDVNQFVGSMDRLLKTYRKIEEDREIPKSAMLAIGAGVEKVSKLAAELSIPFAVANDNCPHQMVIVVAPAEAEQLAEHLLKNGVFVERLPYDRGYHTPTFTYICEPLREFFQTLELKAPALPLYCCTTAEPFPAGREQILDIVADTFAKPLIFQQTIERMYQDGARIFIECGPRGNLTAFVDDILRGRPHLAIPMDQFRRPGLMALQQALGLMAAAHVPVRFEALYERRSCRRLTLDPKQDAVVPEDRQPGVMILPIHYNVLSPPDASEIPPLPAQTAPAVPPLRTPEAPAAIPVRPEVPAAAASAQPLPAVSAAPARAAAETALSAVMPLREPAVEVMPAGWVPASQNAPGLLEEHFALMEDFLFTQEAVMAAAMGSPVALPYHEPSEWDDEMPLPSYDSYTLPESPAVPEAVVAPAAAAIETQPEPASEPAAPAPARSLPMLATAETVRHEPGKSLLLKLQVTDQTFPLLRDHCLYYVDETRSDHGARMGNMPLTGSVELMIEAAQMLFPDLEVTVIKNMLSQRPLFVESGSPGVTVFLKVQTMGTPGGQPLVKCSIHEDKDGEPGAQMNDCLVSLAPALPPPPALEPLDLKNRRDASLRGKALYSEHRLFHGPRLQGVVDIDAVGENGLLGRLEILPNDDVIGGNPNPRFLVDPMLFDAAGQLVGVWPYEYFTEGYVMLPIKVNELHRFAPSPAPGTPLSVRVAIRQISQATLRADYDVILPDGRVWLRCIGWEDWRFYWKENFYHYWRMPRDYPNGRHIEWPELASRGLQVWAMDPSENVQKGGLSEVVWTRTTLNGAEIKEYLGYPEEVRIPWMFERAAAKDAVRDWANKNGKGPIWPAAVQLQPAGQGRHQASGHWAAPGSGPIVSSFGLGFLGVACAGTELSAVTIEPVVPGAQPPETAFVPEEREWIARLAHPAEWTARAIAAKKAVARWLRPDGEDPEFWTSLVIPHLNEATGELAVADPGSAVNAEDSVTVFTKRDGGHIFAVATK